jgi:hypothetical protein
MAGGLRRLLLGLPLLGVVTGQYSYYSYNDTANMPFPFTQPLNLTEPPLQGNDVMIMQNLIVRSPFVKAFNMTGVRCQSDPALLGLF